MANLSAPMNQRPHPGALPDAFDEEVDRARADKADTRRQRLQNAPRLPRRIARLVFVFERNPDAVAEVWDQAQGKCGICGNSTPFVRASNGKPYPEGQDVASEVAVWRIVGESLERLPSTRWGEEQRLLRQPDAVPQEGASTRWSVVAAITSETACHRESWNEVLPASDRLSKVNQRSAAVAAGGRR